MVRLSLVDSSRLDVATAVRMRSGVVVVLDVRRDVVLGSRSRQVVQWVPPQFAAVIIIIEKEGM